MGPGERVCRVAPGGGVPRLGPCRSLGRDGGFVVGARRARGEEGFCPAAGRAGPGPPVTGGQRRGLDAAFGRMRMREPLGVEASEVIPLLPDPARSLALPPFQVPSASRRGGLKTPWGVARPPRVGGGRARGGRVGEGLGPLPSLSSRLRLSPPREGGNPPGACGVPRHAPWGAVAPGRLVVAPSRPPRVLVSFVSRLGRPPRGASPPRPRRGFRWGEEEEGLAVPRERKHKNTEKRYDS